MLSGTTTSNGRSADRSSAGSPDAHQGDGVGSGIDHGHARDDAVERACAATDPGDRHVSTHRTVQGQCGARHGSARDYAVSTERYPRVHLRLSQPGRIGPVVRGVGAGQDLLRNAAQSQPAGRDDVRRSHRGERLHVGAGQ